LSGGLTTGTGALTAISAESADAAMPKIATAKPKTMGMGRFIALPRQDSISTTKIRHYGFKATVRPNCADADRFWCNRC
jgi:predicted component of type VI protein secretion system